MLELEILMPPKVSTPKNYAKIKPKQKQNYGHICTHIEWQEFNFAGSMPLVITL